MELKRSTRQNFKLLLKFSRKEIQSVIKILTEDLHSENSTE